MTPPLDQNAAIGLASIRAREKRQALITVLHTLHDELDQAARFWARETDAARKENRAYAVPDSGLREATWRHAADMALEAIQSIEDDDGWTRLASAVKDICWRVTPYGETEDGDTAKYIVSKGTVHRLVGIAQGVGISASLRNVARVPDPPPDADDAERVPADTDTGRGQ